MTTATPTKLEELIESIEKVKKINPTLIRQMLNRITKEHEYLSINYPTVLDIPEVGQMAEQVKDAILKSDITDSVASYQILRNELKNHEITRPNVMDLLWPYIKRVYD